MLNEKQQRFCLEYLIDYNATQAAIRAGYSPKTAGQQGFDLLKKLEIQEFIKMSSQKTFNKLEITRERVMQEIARLAFVDIRKLYDEEGRLLNIRSIDSDTAAAVCGLEVDELFEGTGQDRTQVGVT